ncbi:MAG: hypothetical protein ACI9W2_001475 [Gammaproteobacteria bacterium]|jgi:hypothetical protein
MDNPYIPPNTDVTDPNPKSHGAVWRWVCGVYLVYRGISGAIAIIVWEQIATLAAAGGTVVPSLGDAARAVGILNVIASTAAGVLLIMKRRWAFHLTIAIFALRIISTAINVVTGGFTNRHGRCNHRPRRRLGYHHRDTDLHPQPNVQRRFALIPSCAVARRTWVLASTHVVHQFYSSPERSN